VNVGVVGVGQMGRPMVARLLAAGFGVRVLARRPDVADSLAASGAVLVSCLVDLPAGCDVVLVCVYTDEQVREVCLGPDGLLGVMTPGSCLVNHTTGSPATGEALEAAAAARGVRMLDAALSGGPADIAKGDLTLLIGGEPEVLEAARPVLAAYSSAILPVGGVGDGQRVKLVNNALFAAQVALARQAEQVLARVGVDPATALPALSRCSGDSYALRATVGLGGAQPMWQAAGRFIAKDVDMVTSVAAAAGVDLGLLGSVARSQPELT
jgi:3-hydroxyisobutyrate dehydrogenase-like beta-hydroxyacid dehydrogenase